MPHNFRQEKTCVVLSGDTTSNPVELEAYDILGLIVPTIDSGTFKVQVSQDNITFYDVYDEGGNQKLTWSASTGARALWALDMVGIIGFRYARVVLGASQGSDRTFTWSFKDSIA